MSYVLRCPGCKNSMKYAPLKGGSGKRKRCVYCGRSFSVAGNTVRKG